MNHFRTLFYLPIVLILFCQCKTKSISTSEQSANKIALSEDFHVYLLDSVSAAKAIATDEKNHFFERVTYAEMEIQMKENRTCDNRSMCIDDYKDFLMQDVENFSETDKSNIEDVFVDISEMLKKVNPKLIDRDILLIKTKGKHYGPGVYYTRENKIIIPMDVLERFEKESFKQTMLHEFFHVFSRYNPETRDQLYALIGFSPIKGKLVLPVDLSQRKLLNPDGTTDYMIKIGNEMAYPLITSTNTNYVESKPTFFNYLEFKLYKLLPGEDGVFHVGNDIPFQNAPDFFMQIKDNTDYIIHPDEIMADNFIYTVYYLADENKLKDFSKEGMELIGNMSSILGVHN